MKIDYASDLHINHWMLWIPNQLKWEQRTRELTKRLIQKGHGEVIVIAGDFGEWNCQALWVLDELSKHYKRVYFTFGNHDLYLLSKRQKKKYGDSLGRLNELVEKASLIPNVVPLIKRVDTYEGKVFAGDVMWYLPKTKKDWEFYRETLNDSSDIKIKGCPQDEIPKKLSQESRDWYDTLEDMPIDVFVSHVPPFHNPFSPFEPNGCYMTDVPFIHAKHWICGHEHLQMEFMKEGVHYHMNAIGYAQHYSHYPRHRNTIPSDTVDDYKSFDIKTIDI